MRVGFLHPGMMGASLAAACDADAIWASAQRSPETAARAQAAGATDVVSVAALVDEVDIIVSICPPAAAEQLAAQVASFAFVGTYVDANAISPTTSRRIGERFEHYVDASVIGPPVTKPGTTRLYLSGQDADEVASLWHASALDARLIEGVSEQLRP